MKFHRRRSEEPEINLIPFIDVLLVVLIFLMLSTTYSRYSELQINLPNADAERLKERPDEILVSVTAEGQYLVNRKPLPGRSVELLTAELRAAATGGDSSVVIVSADAMAAPPAWHAWLTNQWRRPAPSVWARLLQPLSWIYAALTAAHRGLYSAGLAHRKAALRPTIVVGNLVAGGAGKTPTVMAVVRWLQAQGRVPGVISRGYGRQGNAVVIVDRSSRARDVGDEPLLIHLRTGAAVAVGADRVAAATLLCARHPQVDIIVADDGLQHHALARDIEVLVFDDGGVGNGLLLPAGPLRQRLPATIDAHRLVLYSGGRPSTALPGFFGVRRLAGVLPLRAWWSNPNAPPQPMAGLRGRPLRVAAGLARPQAFVAMLQAEGLQLQMLALADHDDFDPLPWPADAADVVVTEKDAVKLDPDRCGSTRVWVATLDFQPEPAFGAALSRLLS